MKAELIIIPKCVINPSSIVIYNEVNWLPAKPKRPNPSTGLFDESGNLISFVQSKRKAEGKVSVQAKRKISKAVDYLITTAVPKKVYERISGKTVLFKVAFITLTLPSEQVHDDKVIISKCLNSFLLECKEFYHVKNYIWRAEKQKNGNIHFHILTDKFIPFNELRNRWNRIVNKLGYVDRYQSSMQEFYAQGFRPSNNPNDKRPVTQQYISYKKAASSNFSNPNSTDIHSTKKIHNIKNYITKYLTKNENEERNAQTVNEFQICQEGRLWSCNHELSGIKGCRLDIDTEIATELKKIFDDGNVRRFVGDYFSVYYVDYHLIEKLGSATLFNYFCRYLFDEFGFNEQLKIAL